MKFNGHRYIVNTKRGPTTYYQCSTYRSSGCKCKLNVKIFDSGGSDVRETGEHSYRVQESATVLRPGRIWDRVTRELSAKYQSQAVKVLVRDEAINSFNYTRRQAGGGDVYRQIETLPAVVVSESDDRSFVQFNLFYENFGERQRILGMGHPDLICLLMYPGASLFIDATYSITPRPFQQTLVIMAHDPAYDVYISVLTILLEAKDERNYRHVLHGAALIKGVRDQFPGIHVIGCLFHWKQAIRRKLVDLRFSANQISEAMAPGVLDVLAVIARDEIRTKGIPYAMSLMSTKGCAQLWTRFWDYFIRTWMTMFPPTF
ncbi:hypothetical protein PHMEG_00014102 [Phytophthora megakarya]|uniref:FLYWCH-type domain-containing protein n=1 Tax=Phytophthora megakarya TaxID=4795 RepID=A0A225W567_9STRA|nr:hypothetical protein PHMEG_00014102 [Phytophthora megakarya]